MQIFFFSTHLQGIQGNAKKYQWNNLKETKSSVFSSIFIVPHISQTPGGMSKPGALEEFPRSMVSCVVYPYLPSREIIAGHPRFSCLAHIVVPTLHIPYSPQSLRVGVKLFLTHWEHLLLGTWVLCMRDQPKNPKPKQIKGFADIPPLEPTLDPD